MKWKNFMNNRSFYASLVIAFIGISGMFDIMDYLVRFCPLSKNPEGDFFGAVALVFIIFVVFLVVLIVWWIVYFIISRNYRLIWIPIAVIISGFIIGFLTEFQPIRMILNQ